MTPLLHFLFQAIEITGAVLVCFLIYQWKKHTKAQYQPRKSFPKKTLFQEKIFQEMSSTPFFGGAFGGGALFTGLLAKDAWESEPTSISPMDICSPWDSDFMKSSVTNPSSSDYITDPAYSHLAENIFHTHQTDPAFAYEPDNVFHDTAVDPTFDNGFSDYDSSIDSCGCTDSFESFDAFDSTGSFESSCFDFDSCGCGSSFDDCGCGSSFDNSF